MKCLQELIVHLPTSPSLTPIQGKAGHSPKAASPAPRHLLGIPGLERVRKFHRWRRQLLFSYTPTSGDEIPDFSPSSEVLFPRAIQLQRSQSEMHYWTVSPSHRTTALAPFNSFFQLVPTHALLSLRALP